MLQSSGTRTVSTVVVADVADVAAVVAVVAAVAVVAVVEGAGKDVFVSPTTTDADCS